MRIERIHIKNFRQYQNIDLEFPKKDNDVHVIIGVNGLGKTTILNAINWCLYYDEPHSSKSTKKLPLLNLDAIESNNPHDHEVSVKFEAVANDGTGLIFERTEKFNIHKNTPITLSNELIAKVRNRDGTSDVYKEELAENIVESFVPSAIREFFFFDGEQLDNYFLDVKTQNIKNQIFILSHIHLLATMNSRLQEIDDDLRREGNRIDPKTEEKTRAVNSLKIKIKEEKEKLSKLKEQIVKGDDAIKELDDKLTGVPNIKVLEEQLKALEERDSKFSNLIIDKEQQRKDNLIINCPAIFLEDAIATVINLLDEKEAAGELPTPIDTDLLEKILETGNCQACGREVNDDAIGHIHNLINNLELSSEASKLLTRLQSQLKSNKREVKKFIKDSNNIQDDIDSYEDELVQINKEIKNIHKKIGGYDNEKIKSYFNQREALKISVKRDSNLIGTIKSNIDYLEKDLVQKTEEERESFKLKAENTRIVKKRDLCNAALDAIELTNDLIMDETRRKIELETKNNFFELLWKKETFKDVKINEDYTLSLIHEKGYDFLGSVSAAERELLALSFTLGLHEVSGYDSPIMIDTPVARVTDDHRTNFANIFLKVSENKQIILLLTPAEFSDDIKTIFGANNISKYVIKTNETETCSSIEMIPW